MRTLLVAAIAAAGFMVGATACGGEPAAPGAAPSASAKAAAAPVAGADDVVATVDGSPITRGQLEAKLKPELIEVDNQRFEVLNDGLDSMISEMLVEKESKARGVTTEALLATEVTSKLAAPSDVDIQKIFDANKAQLGNATLDQVKDRIVQYMQGQQEAQLQQAFIDSLRAKYKTTVALKPPTIDVPDGGAPARGPATAKVTIIEFSDYECPFCKRAEPTVEQVVAAYPDQVRLVYRHYPLPFHKSARPAAEAAACANAQGKFWEYHDKVFAAPSLDEASLKKIAGEVGLDQAKFDACFDNKEQTAAVEKDIADASGVGVRGTPAFFINGRMISGAQPFEKFKEIIDQELAG